MSFNGSIAGSPTFGAAKFSNGLTATDDTNHIALPTGLYNFGASADWTIECWLKNGTVALKVAVASDTANAIWMGTAANGHFAVSVNGTGGFAAVILDSGVLLNDGLWHHCAMVMTGGTSLSVFVDGALKATATGVFASPGGSAIGGIGYYPVAGTIAWPGAIDEVAYWNSAKYTGAYTVPSAAYTGSESNLRALYHLESNATDSTSFSAGTPVVGEYGPTTVALSWVVATGGTGPYTYQVQRAPDSSGSPGSFSNTGSPQSGLTFIDSGLTASTKYWWRVVATDSLSTTATSSNAPATTLATGLKYNRLDGTAPANGQAVMVLVPNANSAVPYVGASTTLVIYHHGAGEDQTGLVTDSLKTTTVDAFANAGYIMAGTNAQGDNWGNQTACNDYPDLFRYILNAGYSIGKVVFWGQSMGGLTASSCLAQGKIPKVVAWLGTYPVCSLSAEYALSFTSAINTAYGITGSGTATYTNKAYGSDPALFVPISFRGAWMRFYASPSDTFVPKASNSDVLAALVAGSTPEAVVVVCSGNHGDPSHFQPSDYVAFIQRALLNPPNTTGVIGAFSIGS